MEILKMFAFELLISTYIKSFSNRAHKKPRPNGDNAHTSEFLVIT
jgi:hypothetical protein